MIACVHTHIVKLTGIKDVQHTSNERGMSESKNPSCKCHIPRASLWLATYCELIHQFSYF